MATRLSSKKTLQDSFVAVHGETICVERKEKGKKGERGGKTVLVAPWHDRSAMRVEGHRLQRESSRVTGYRSRIIIDTRIDFADVVLCQQI